MRDLHLAVEARQAVPPVVRASQATNRERGRSLRPGGVGGGGKLEGAELLGRRVGALEAGLHPVQELAFGGLPEVVREEIRSHVPEDRLDASETDAARMERRRRKEGLPVVGTRLIREWRGTRHEVTVAMVGKYV